MAMARAALAQPTSPAYTEAVPPHSLQNLEFMARVASAMRLQGVVSVDAPVREIANLLEREPHAAMRAYSLGVGSHDPARVLRRLVSSTSLFSHDFHWPTQNFSLISEDDQPLSFSHILAAITNIGHQMQQTVRAVAHLRAPAEDENDKRAKDDAFFRLQYLPANLFGTEEDRRARLAHPIVPEELLSPGGFLLLTQGVAVPGRTGLKEWRRLLNLVSRLDEDVFNIARLSPRNPNPDAKVRSFDWRSRASLQLAEWLPFLRDAQETRLDVRKRMAECWTSQGLSQFETGAYAMAAKSFAHAADAVTSRKAGNFLDSEQHYANLLRHFEAYALIAAGRKAQAADEGKIDSLADAFFRRGVETLDRTGNVFEADRARYALGVL